MTQAALALLGMSAAEYHADPCESPSLSASMIHILCTQSPAHARAAHPRLNSELRREEKDAFDIGAAAHALLLEGDAGVEVVDAENWRTAAARAARDEARAVGRVPLLANTLANVETMVATARKQLADRILEPVPFADGEPEQTLIWDEGGVMCRARLDWLRHDLAAIDDYKTTSKSADPESWNRTMFGIGGDIQAAFYLRGLHALTGVTATFRWIVQETYAPHALSVVTPGSDVLTIADKKIEYALELWRQCLATDHWPAYPTGLYFASLPAYEEARWLAREEREAA